MSSVPDFHSANGTLTCAVPVEYDTGKSVYRLNDAISGDGSTIRS